MYTSHARRIERLGGFMGGTLALLASVSRATPPTLYVDDDAPPGGDGLSWQSAFQDLQDAIAATSSDFGEQREIRIAQGTYTPDRGTGDRFASFSLASSAPMLLGGFAGLGSADPDERDPRRFVTTLSGDLNGDDIPIFSNRADNSRTVLRVYLDRASERAHDAVLDGLTIRGGYSDSYYYPYFGGGITVNGGYAVRVSIRNCRITDNYSARSGGGIYCVCADLSVQDSVIDANYASEIGGGIGTLYTCGNLEIARCVFANNESNAAGAISTSAHTISLSDSLFTANTGWNGPALGFGGGLVTVRQCTFNNNYTPDDPTIRLNNVNAKLQGTIIRHSPQASPPLHALSIRRAVVQVVSSDVQGGLQAVQSEDSTLDWNINNIDLDPRWTLPAGPDGLIQTWQDNDYSLLPDSPCIDRGHNWHWDGARLDLLGNPRITSEGCPCDARADIGAIERPYDCSAAPVPIVYVNSSAPTGGDGRSWNTAVRTLGEALATPGTQEIWVAAGTYTPTGETPSRENTFTINCEVQIYAGFAGFESTRDERNPDVNTTILSADLLGNDTNSPASRTDNAHTIISIQSGSVTLDGFIITAANGIENGAVRAAQSSLTLRHCILRDNHLATGSESLQSSAAGSALRTYDSHVQLRHTSFEHNITTRADYGIGSAVFMEAGTARLEQCHFTENIGRSDNQIYGAGLWMNADHARLIDCAFIRNQAISLATSPNVYSSADTAAIALNGDHNSLIHCSFIDNSCIASSDYSFTSAAAGWFLGDHTHLTNCLFAGNRCQSERQTYTHTALFNADSPILTNCTFVANTADATRANSGSVRFDDPNAQLLNCIFHNNRAGVRRDAVAQIDYINGALITPVNSCIQGWTDGLPGINTILLDPLFIDPLGPDALPGTGDEDYSLAPASPCIDTGDSSRLPADTFDLDADTNTAERLPFDLRRRARVIGPAVDMGAFEYAGIPCRVDLVADGRVDTADFFQFLSWFFELNPSADFDNNGVVNSIDFFTYFQDWARGC